jgi:hypothetical protein
MATTTTNGPRPTHLTPQVVCVSLYYAENPWSPWPLEFHTTAKQYNVRAVLLPKGSYPVKKLEVDLLEISPWVGPTPRDKATRVYLLDTLQVMLSEATGLKILPFRWSRLSFV